MDCRMGIGMNGSSFFKFYCEIEAAVVGAVYCFIKTDGWVGVALAGSKGEGESRAWAGLIQHYGRLAQKTIRQREPRVLVVVPGKVC